jgi:hypothetical protein
MAGSPTVDGPYWSTIGTPYAPAPSVGHRITEAGVRLVLPSGRDLTDEEAKKLAWGILADLDPDNVSAMPDVVTYREACRLEVLKAINDGANTIPKIAKAVGWGRRKVERRMYELIADGRVERLGLAVQHRTFRVAKP